MLNIKFKQKLLLGVVILAAYYIGGAHAGNSAATSFTDPSKTIMVSQKTPQFTILLSSNATTGYSWLLADYNPQFVKVINHVYHPPTSQMVGAPGKDQWTFAVNPIAFSAPHVIKIGLLYARPWDINDNSKTIVFTVVTQK